MKIKQLCENYFSKKLWKKLMRKYIAQKIRLWVYIYHTNDRQKRRTQTGSSPVGTILQDFKSYGTQ